VDEALSPGTTPARPSWTVTWVRLAGGLTFGVMGAGVRIDDGLLIVTSASARNAWPIHRSRT
jgi:hypothetical protein